MKSRGAKESTGRAPNVHHKTRISAPVAKPEKVETNGWLRTELMTRCQTGRRASGDRWDSVGCAQRSRSRASSFADWKRLPGSFSRHFRMIRSISAEVRGF